MVPPPATLAVGCMRQGRTGVGIALELGGFSGWRTVLLGAARTPLVLALVQDPFRACLRAAALLCGRCSGTDGSAGGLRALRSRQIGVRALVAAAQPGIGRFRELMCHAWRRWLFAGVRGRCSAVRLRVLASWLGRSDCCLRERAAGRLTAATRVCAGGCGGVALLALNPCNTLSVMVPHSM